MSVYDTLDYKEYLRNWVAERPGGGRGEYRKIASALNVSTTLISQVVNGEKHFSLELASDLCDYLGLADREADHFLLLVDYGRAGTHAYRQRLKRRLEAARQQALKLSQRMRKDRDLTDAESATYYSHWIYTAITHLTACDPELSADALAERLKVPRSSIAKVMEFLFETGILVNKSGVIEVGIKNTHIGSESPLVAKHHQNWRLQGFNRMAFASDDDLFYTAPMSLSVDVAQQIRRELPTIISKLIKMVEPSPSEVVRCLNIDWFSY